MRQHQKVDASSRKWQRIEIAAKHHRASTASRTVFILSDHLGIAAPAIIAARDDRLAWIAYPKSRQLGTNLNRDTLAALVTARGAGPVRSISIDGVWSAIRFRPI